MGEHTTPSVRQDFVLIEYDEHYSTLCINSGDSARVLLFAAQWLDQHRDYTLDSDTAGHIGITVQPGHDTGTTNLVLHLRRTGEHQPAQLGPWAQAGL